MDNQLLIIGAVLVGLYVLTKNSKFGTMKTSKFGTIQQIKDSNYTNQTEPTSCDFATEERVFPSGRIPGSYLGLTEQEKQTLLIKFLEYNGSIDLNTDYQPFTNA